MGRDLARILDERLALHPRVTYLSDEGVLLVPRVNPVERLIARLLRRGDPRIRLVLDARGIAVIDTILHPGGPGAAGSDDGTPRTDRLGDRPMRVPATPATGRSVASALGVDTGPEAFGRQDPDLLGLLVFLETLRKGRVLVTEPI